MKTKMHKIISLAMPLVMIFALCFQVIAANPVTASQDWLDNWENKISTKGKVWATVGEDDDTRCFTWISKNKNTAFRYKLINDRQWVEPKVVSYTSMYGYINTVTLKNLIPGTYHYNYTADKVDYPNVEFKVHKKDGNFIAMFSSDPQLGRSNKNSDSSVADDGYGWERTLEASKKQEAEFILCAGDQVNDGFSQKQFNAFLSPKEHKSIPLAPTAGNHELFSNFYPLYFKNVGVKQADNEYYFLYENALFIVLDSNVFNSAYHEKTINAAVTAHPDAKWRIVMLHHSAYSVDPGEKANEQAAKINTPIFDKYEIDLVLSGHDHSYGRTHNIYNDKVSDKGPVYFEAGCASACKCGHFNDYNRDYIAKAVDLNEASYSIMEFTENKILIKSYKTDTNEMFDSFEISKNIKNEEIPQFQIISYITSFFEFLKNVLK